MENYTARKQSELFWAIASKVVSPADGDAIVLRIPKRSLLTDIIIIKSVAFSETGATLTVGTVADPDKYMSSAAVDPDALGVVSMKAASSISSGGAYNLLPELITISVDADSGTAGTIQVFATYIQLSN